MLRAIVLGDTHIEKLNNLFPNGLEKTLWSWQYAINYCEENSIDHLIQLGDIFDSPYPSQYSIRKLLRILHGTKVQIWSMLGNHDYDADHNSVELAQWVTNLKGSGPVIFTKPTLQKIEGVNFWFAPYPHTKQPKEKAVCIGHFDMPGARMDNGRLIKGKKLKLTMPWIIGHLHSFQDYKNVVYPGAPLQFTFGDQPEKFMLDITVLKGKLKWQAIPLQTPFKLKNIIIEHEKNLIFKEERDTYYKLFIKSNIRLPENFLLENPKILKLDGYKTKEQLEAIQIDNVDTKAINVDPFYKLDHWLLGKGLKPKQVRKAVKIAQRELERI